MRSHRFIGALALVLFALCIAGIAQAQTSQPPGTRSTACDPLTPNNAICLVIGAPSTMVDGTPTVLPITYRIEQQFNGGAWTTIAASTTVLNFYVKNLAPGPYVYRVYAKCGTCSAESDPSPTGSRSATAPVIITGPPALQVVQVTITSDHAPVYRILTGNKRGELYGLVPKGRDCDGPVLFTYRGKSFRHVAVNADEVWPKGTSTDKLAAPCA